MKTATRMHKNPLKSAGFRVLKAPDVPSVLVELGYVSNKDDLEHLRIGQLALAYRWIGGACDRHVLRQAVGNGGSGN